MNKNIVFSLKGYLLSLLICAFALFGFHNFCSADATKTISLSDPAKISEIKLKNEDILKLEKGITSFDLSTLPSVSEKIQIAIETIEEVKFTGKLPDNYDLQLLILHNNIGSSNVIPKTTSAFYVNKGTEKNPDVLDLYTSEFNLNLLPPASSIHSLSDGQKASLCVMDGSSIEGIEFSGTIPENYNVANIFVLSEKDKETFKNAFSNANINVCKVEEMDKKFSEYFNTSDEPSKQESESKQSSDEGYLKQDNTALEKTSIKSDGDSFSMSALLICFLSFGVVSSVCLLKKHKNN